MIYNMVVYSICSKRKYENNVLSENFIGCVIIFDYFYILMFLMTPITTECVMCLYITNKEILEKII